MPDSVTLSELLPTNKPILDPLQAVADEPRTASTTGINSPHRPWVYTNMVSSLDGAVEVDGTSGALGGAADRAVFAALRAVADVILVGAATAVTENYRPPGDQHRATRTARGQAARPRIVILTRSLGIEPTHRVFANSDARPLILTTAAAPADRRRDLTDVADVINVGDHDLDLNLALTTVGSLGHQRALLEGGPRLNGQFLAAGLIDEWNMTLAAVLAGGQSARTAHGPTLPDLTTMRLARLWHADDTLFGRWIKHTDSPTT